MPGTEALTGGGQLWRLKGPLLVAWQMTRDCDLACLHCCTGSAPGKRLPDELDAAESQRLAGELIANEIPYVLLCGGEPLVVPHFLAVAMRLGRAGVQLKIETNGQRLDAALLQELAKLPIRSVQVSLDGDTPEVYARQRPGASLEKAHAACRAVRAAGLPLEITFAPTRFNIHEAAAVIERARSLGAFRFNTGALMRIGTAARLWQRLQPSAQQYREFRGLLERTAVAMAKEPLELCYTPFSIADALRRSIVDPPATLLVLPNGWVKVAGALPQICADLRRDTLQDAWTRYRTAWCDAAMVDTVRHAATDEARQADANAWQTDTVVAYN
ncbi:MAG TPA: radical SAM protein [Steroidobacteraceae bacterium]|nr:radical SAM protein [Steroidobacteraceae bacterium]